MHWSVETRVPFLDHRLVEFAAGIPEDWKMHDGYSKFILRQAMSPRPAARNPREPRQAGIWHGRTVLVARLSSVARKIQSALEEFIDLAELKHRVGGNGKTVNQSYWLPISLGLWLQTAFPQVH